ncbi:NAD-dependent epimerase/dehydratase family protein [Paenibacillus sp. LMG 31461]|uniref:NAD-dependent epimerase/dehydratase family protein n=1 Tax=Paenibacillus plantarum TaxID=2654975 RepID=A0ABX1X6V2_9BACL|nr:NAD(P)-dependent oxidoreductase [Paenibacillus plantarum]NOU63803.1 NAD-dependent epimerase/dehydratase family protein [Paenibacillus plantarum]
MRTLEDLDKVMSAPSPALIQFMQELEGDIMLLGVGGKMGPSLARLAMNAIRAAGVDKKVYGVSRFSEAGLQEELQSFGVETIACDLLNDEALQALPDVPNVIYMAGTKFGTTGKEHFTWVMNAYLPGRVAEKFSKSRIVVFSTGNVYPFTPVTYGGAHEAISPAPIGEYGQSCLGRERMFEHYSHKNGTPVLIYRLNYAIDLRYGVLLEIAKSLKEGRAIDLSMGHFNCIWQGDANEIAIRSLLATQSPANFLNVTGPETVSVKYAAQQLGQRLGIEPIFKGQESETALLSNAAKSMQLFGYPRVSLLQMLDWVAEWIEHGGSMINKPTHFQEREGKF